MRLGLLCSACVVAAGIGLGLEVIAQTVRRIAELIGAA